MFQTMDAMGGVGEISVVTKDEEKKHRLTIADLLLTKTLNPLQILWLC